MNYVLLSTSPQGAVAGRFRDEFEARGLHLTVLSYTTKAKLALPAFIIPRIAPEKNAAGTRCLRALEKAGARSLNSAAQITAARDKVQAGQLLHAAQVPTPPTFLLTPGMSYKTCTARLGTPFIVKPVHGTNGVGVTLVRSEDDFARALKQQDDLLAQTFIAEAAGADTRLVVVGGTVVAAMVRQARRGEFRSNLHQGATARPYTPTPQEQKVAILAARTFGLGLAGVDIVQTKNGPSVLEVNPSPGLLIEKITGVNVAGAIVGYAVLVATRT